MKNGKAFGKRVALMRERRRLSTQELADKTGISYQSLWRIERGQHKDPGLFTAARIARELGVSLDYLAGLYEGDDKDNELLPAAVALVGA
jgi:transcriptional regulator with XRE-family HTH domain